ncbi:hypothetical protein D3C75_604770 [compost metagenome]
MVVYATHQDGVHFYTLETGGKSSVYAIHNLAEFVLPGNSVELASIKTIDADIHRGQPGVTPLLDITRQTIAVSRHRNLANTGVFMHGGNDVGKIFTQRGFATGQAYFFSTQGSKCARDAANFINVEETFVRHTVRLVAIRQAIVATEIANVGNRQTQVKKLTRECIGKLGSHVHLPNTGDAVISYCTLVTQGHGQSTVSFDLGPEA